MSDMSIVYSQQHSSSFYEGVLFEKNFLESYLQNQVHAKYYDEEGTTQLVEEFSDTRDTGFNVAELKNIFQIDPTPIDWKIGECIAECFLEDNKKVRFHYNSSRDAKNQEGSQHGADLVGFTELNGETVFLFGEVKTSDSDKSPPHVLYGRFGMVCQLENIMNSQRIQGILIRWLAFKRSSNNSTEAFKEDFTNALRNYIESGKRKQQLSGILIRDITPNESDLKSRYETFKQQLKPETFLTLSALYLPIKIDELEKFIVSGDENNVSKT
ncbi:MAG: hypothetical protein J4F36_03680 [Nitrosopumilaceae archaeon]|nr:hypothetical protein [Nitrosopumilaceae archaeon]